MVTRLNYFPCSRPAMIFAIIASKLTGVVFPLRRFFSDHARIFTAVDGSTFEFLSDQYVWDELQPPMVSLQCNFAKIGNAHLAELNTAFAGRRAFVGHVLLSVSTRSWHSMESRVNIRLGTSVIISTSCDGCSWWRFQVLQEVLPFNWRWVKRRWKHNMFAWPMGALVVVSSHDMICNRKRKSSLVSISI